MKLSPGIIILGIAVSIVGTLHVFRDDVADYQRVSAASRQVQRICTALNRGEIDVESLCQHRVVDLEPLKGFYSRIREKDGAWYAARGWSYYPSVRCEQDATYFTLMDYHFTCSPDGEFERVRDLPDTVGASAPCFSTATERRLRQVQSVLKDGTIVLDGSERVYLAGVRFPKNTQREGSSVGCRDEALNYVRARLSDGSIFILDAEKKRDNRFRRPVYAFSSNNSFVNLELIRFGFAYSADKAVNNPEPLSCRTEFSTAEEAAEKRNTGGWKSGCLVRKKVNPDPSPSLQLRDTDNPLAEPAIGF